MLPYPLTNFEIQKFYENEHEFNGVYSRHSLPKLNDEKIVRNVDEFKSIWSKEAKISSQIFSEYKNTIR